MKRHYRISPEGRPPEPSDAEISRYRDAGRLMYGYQRATRLLHRRPAYKDPRTFLALLLILLLTWLIADAVKDEPDRPMPPTEIQGP